MVEYSYDAWGNHTIKAYNKTIANANPFRYRSYFYDTDTGLYYLKTRYYDPEVGRFLNMDAVDYADPETLGGLNLYSYCNNNPVMYSDPTGEFVISSFLIALAITTVAITATGAVVGGISAAIKNEDVLTGIGNGALVGLMLAGSFSLIALGVGTPLAGGCLGSILVGAGVGSAFTLNANLNAQLSNSGFGSLDIGQSAKSWGIRLGVGALAGGAGHVFSSFFNYYGQQLCIALAGKTFLGLKISNILSGALLFNGGGLVGGLVGGYIGGSIINFIASDTNLQNQNIPMWIASIIKFIWNM